jgi:hypothetical protein
MSAREVIENNVFQALRIAKKTGERIVQNRDIVPSDRTAQKWGDRTVFADRGAPSFGAYAAVSDVPSSSCEA